ncbi:branched-chain amino acid ABC transporter permease [Microbacterium pseudoresistens]|uniref:Branched-chain amino acid transport system permease protein n=1 Tax=Microbacterium pseudoresistens TaxID=640634 RepID=A0A7Y9ETV5_9MICO|nr:branched-chain amino acid ABC transporter permease [Microbacterium pseudoresistens]NYD53850.1 branched-chain amino acid transport system permease protein [Microbacterium pseudoresistens]
MDFLLVTSLSALVGISTLVISALGLSITFGIMGVINMAHGEFIMIGAFVTVILTSSGVPFVLAIVCAVAAGAMLGLIVERLLISRLYGRRIESTLLATFGLSLVLQQAAVLLIGTTPRGIQTPFGSLAIGSYSIGWYSLLIIGIACLCVIATYLVFTRTRYGMLARATMQNRDMAASLGVNTRWVNATTFTLGSAFAALAGAVLSPLLAVVPSMGLPLISSAFMTVVLGGPAVLAGLVAASGVLGASREIVANAVSPVLGTAALMVVAMLLLRMLPNGISASWKRTL